ncbi:helix-turn-helix domain-containing protein [Streptomyces sp. RKAG293]|uniref:RNA-guided endonuclease InsQ/TnpB family protein n=1 Tax=Streptomyces sp. RKAG293 TaxID=2893403 RepID=UPI0020335B34|nr:helix-turn-helix domain-containing protein [Streptomyces sp. RKAG293]MCM2419210.1 helix-turn-helix domain-containing protein [Streptomyces sp. RKAG293]
MERRVRPAGTTERTYRFRCYPNPVQSQQLHRTFGACRWVYDQGLELRSSAWRQHHLRIGYTESCRALTGWRNTEETGWLREISSVALQQSLRHLDNAYNRFFRGSARHPQRKRKHRAKDAATYVQAGVGFRWAADGDRPGAGRLTLAKMAEPLDIRWSRPLPAGAVPRKQEPPPARVGNPGRSRRGEVKKR